MSIARFTSEDADYFKYLDKEIFVGDVLDGSSGSSMSAGYYRNAKKGEKNEWVVTYDEVLVVTKGAVTVRTADGAKTARAGEILFLAKGTEVAYEAAEDNSEAVYVTFPHWLETQQKSPFAHLLEAYAPVGRTDETE